MDGAEQLASLARTLKEMGDKGLQRELSKGINAAVRPFRAAVAQSARETLPSGGGLNEVVAAKVQPRTRRASSQRASGVRLVATGKQGAKGLRRINSGQVRHPVFGSDRWVTQAVTPGFWDRAVEDVGPEVRRQVEAAAAEVVRKIDGSVR